MNRISRRNFLTGTIAGGVGSVVLPHWAQAAQSKDVKTRYIAAYDTETAHCLKACARIVEVHKRFEMPATFFIVGRTLQANPGEYKQLLDHPLFEIASHSYSHQMLRDHIFCGPAVSHQQQQNEIFKAKELIEQVFERPCIGFRTPCGFDDGLKGAVDVLKLFQQAGHRYVSSLAWGPDYSMPALLRKPFNYSAEGFADIWELPAHGWHENLLKDNNHWGPKRLTLWPAPMPEAIPDDFVKTPEDEFSINRVFLEKAREKNNPFVSLIWHPWSLHSFDPEMKMLELTFTHVRKLGLKPCTYADLYRELSASSGLLTRSAERQVSPTGPAL